MYMIGHNTKLAMAFTAGVLAMYVFVAWTERAEAPSSVSVSPVATTTEETDTASAGAPNTTTAQQQTYTPPPSPPPQPAVQYPYRQTVEFTGTRFLPDEVKLITGGTVTWVNGSDERLMWIASNLHPTHSAYPVKSSTDCSGSSFDQCYPVPPGGSWSFTFSEDGKWHYHNEEKPDVTGMIRVMSEEDFDTEF